LPQATTAIRSYTRSSDRIHILHHGNRNGNRNAASHLWSCYLLRRAPRGASGGSARSAGRRPTRGTGTGTTFEDKIMWRLMFI
jgi:hypothetical protein